MADPFSRAKDALLPSGLPLEMTIERRLRESGFWDVAADFPYWRAAEGGHKDFSVDIRARRSIVTPWVTFTKNCDTPLTVHGSWDLLVECKYRKPQVKWLFAPLPPADRSFPSGPRLSHCFVNSRGTVAIGGGEYGHIDSSTDARSIPLVTRGVEMRPGAAGNSDNNDEAYGVPIRRGLSQLQFAHLPRLHDALCLIGTRREIPDRLTEEADLRIATLILVTTADLWIFRRDVDLDRIELASALEDIAEPASAVEFVTTTSRELHAHQQDWLSAMERAIFVGPVEQDVVRRELWRKVSSGLAGWCPSVFITNSRHFDALLAAQGDMVTATVRHFVEEYAAQFGWVVR